MSETNSCRRGETYLRWAWGLLAAPFVPGLLFDFTLSARSIWRRVEAGNAELTNFDLFPLVTFYSSYLTVPSTLLLGVPILWWYHRVGVRTWWSYAAAGAAIGGLVAILIGLAKGFTFCAGFGAVSAFYLWVMLHTRRQAALGASLVVILLVAGIFL